MRLRLIRLRVTICCQLDIRVTVQVIFQVAYRVFATNKQQRIVVVQLTYLRGSQQLTTDLLLIFRGRTMRTSVCPVVCV